ncbi:MAG: site-2 protease family protein [Candidatus Aureabacteria bacterium]|nr:site-2 protease family protein [Candidatus Auribacterota bacterium]
MSSLPIHLISIAKFLVVLWILVFVHELGHFLAARLCRVRVKKFYLGFDLGGLKLLRFRRGPTEYGIGVLPLGGYVKMAGQEDLPSDDPAAVEKIEEEDRDVPPEERFDRKPLWQRALIIAAGPFMNVILGFLLFILIAFQGMTVFKPYQGTTVGNVESGSPAAQAGLLPGDEVLSVDGWKVQEWRDFLLRIMTARADVPLPIVFRRGGEERQVMVSPRVLPGSDRPRIGVAPAGRAMVWVEETSCAAARSGLATGMVVTALDGRPSLYPALQEEIASRPGGEIRLGMENPETGETFEIEVETESHAVIPGLYLKGGTVAQPVDYRARGETASLRKGDRILEANGEEVSPERLAEIIAASAPESPLRLIVERPRRLFFLPPSRLTIALTVMAEGRIPGISFDYYPDAVTVRYRGWKAVRQGAAETVRMIETIFSFLYYLLVGLASPADLAGPVRIFDLTRQLHHVSEIVHFLALISVNLAVVNLFPLPVLDGGHILFILIEAVRRRPLSRRALIIAQQIGLAVIILLFLMVTYNDIIQVFFKGG